MFFLLMQHFLQFRIKKLHFLFFLLGSSMAGLVYKILTCGIKSQSIAQKVLYSDVCARNGLWITEFTQCNTAAETLNHSLIQVDKIRNQSVSSIHSLYPVLLSRELVLISNSYCARGVIHPGKVTSPSQGLTETNNSFTLILGAGYQITQHACVCSEEEGNQRKSMHTLRESVQRGIKIKPGYFLPKRHQLEPLLHCVAH